MTRADVAAVLLALAGLGALYAGLWSAPAPAHVAEIRGAGDAVRRYPLHGTQIVEIAGRDGTVVIAIEAGRARFLRSSCRNQVCVHRGWLSHAGDAAACLPNGVSLRLTGTADYDAIAF